MHHMHDLQPIRRKIDSRIVAFGSSAIGCRHIAPHATTVRTIHDLTSGFPDSACIYMGVSWWSIHLSSMTPVVHSGPSAASYTLNASCFLLLCVDNGTSLTPRPSGEMILLGVHGKSTAEPFATRHRGSLRYFLNGSCAELNGSSIR
ncbi:hypothetical protein F5Y05DRAFT_100411 [Hypoxylon sp. FL0543]|nr:hypothetical protein F5Y05DRAFT_100411 [Hypoxylon sp. FL0543]